VSSSARIGAERAVAGSIADADAHLDLHLQLQLPMAARRARETRYFCFPADRPSVEGLLRMGWSSEEWSRPRRIADGLHP
jgi:hypothetical protein